MPAGLFRLPRDKALRRRAGGRQRRVRRLGKQDWLVRWHRTGRPAWMSARRWKRLPQSLVLRQVSFRIRRKGRRDRWGWLITTLLDPVEYPAQQLAELYGQRWQVEVCFRDLKRTLGLRKLSARGAQALRKELLTFVLLYNLVRGVMRQAAERQRVEARRVSFVDALRWLLWSAPREPLPELALNPERHRATQPRRIKGGGKKYLLLNRPRSALQLPPAEVRV